MKAAAVVVALLLILAGSAPAHGGAGGGHSGGFGGGHFGGGHSRFGGHRGHGKSGHGGLVHGQLSSAGLSPVLGPPRLTTFVGFGSVPGVRLFFVADSFFCPFNPRLISLFCRFCGGFGGGFFLFPGSGFFDGFEDVYAEPATVLPPSDGSLQPARTVLVFTNGWTFEVTNYWIDEEGELHYATTYGGTNVVALQSLDLYATARENARRGAPFTLKLRPAP